MYAVTVFVILLSSFSSIECQAQSTPSGPSSSFQFGSSAADSAALANGLITFSDSQTFTVDNANFSQGIASSTFSAADPSSITGGSLSFVSVARGVNDTVTSVAEGYANSLLLASNPSGTGVIGEGASSVLGAVTPTAAGLNATAATVARVNGFGTILWQNQAGGVVASQNGPAAYNFTTRYNATGVNATVEELVNVRLVSNEKETGSALTVCVGGQGCGTKVN
eukprot:TRINITY_DN6612_c0_g1_i2.p1 TRINITY_DN6612_c0_g1~~TRINITY_DN6612_c0_g1_i2.p1  ORF type:complete len:259 (-),score=25.19 TRINITY_DN6612_c0_g1_i2:478-1149(-)